MKRSGPSVWFWRWQRSFVPRLSFVTRLLGLVLVGLVLAASSSPRFLANAQMSNAAEAGGVFRRISPEPGRLASGSPFLLTVELAVPVSAVKGSFTGRELLFFPSHGSSKLWHALAGVDVETAPGSYPLALEATTPEGKVLRMTQPLVVVAANYRTTTLSVPQNFVEPDAATQKEIAADKELKDRVFAHSALLPEWSGDFARPVKSAPTDSFGSRRTFNGKLASIHRGMDFRAPSGTPVAAANSGKVILARKLFYEGNCVVIDHGQGFMTLYMHFSRIDVAEGSTVRKGEHLGLSGATGRVTGPHLHFAVRWQGAYLDPAGLFQLRLENAP